MPTDDTLDTESTAWVRVARHAELPTDGTGLALEVAGRAIALFIADGEVRAIDDSCPHQGGSLGLGVVLEGEVTCPWHGWHFELATGRNTDGLAACVAVHRTRISAAGDVEVAWADRPV
ncbi:MAG: Rieske 2Fe-2S domain-containing protein [Planctomycetota bacterium]|nr:Rieske 2Fe-2S domain-containing protein [Planctomycetota bacterium]